MKVMLLKPFSTYFNMFTYNIYQNSFVISMTYTCVANGLEVLCYLAMKKVILAPPNPPQKDFEDFQVRYIWLLCGSYRPIE